MPRDKIKELIDTMILFDLTFKVTLEGKVQYLMRFIHGELLRHLKLKDTILFPEMGMDTDVDSITARECAWCLQILKSRVAGTEWPKYFEPAHKENGMVLSLLTKGTLESYLYKGCPTIGDVLFIGISFSIMQRLS